MIDFKYLLLLCAFVIISACKQNALLPKYSYSNEYGTGELSFDLMDSTFERVLQLGVGAQYDKGRVIFLGRNKIHLQVRESHVEELDYPDTLESGKTIFFVDEWDRNEWKDTFPKFPYDINWDGGEIGVVDSFGFLIVELDSTIKKITVNHLAYGIYGADVFCSDFRNTAWKILLGSKSELVEGAYYYTIRDGYLKSKIGFRFVSVKE